MYLPIQAAYKSKSGFKNYDELLKVLGEQCSSEQLTEIAKLTETMCGNLKGAAEVDCIFDAAVAVGCLSKIDPKYK